MEEQKKEKTETSYKSEKNELAKKGDFIEIKFTGYSQGQVFDSNIKEDLKKINSSAKAKPVVVIIGQKMVVSGLDEALEGKEIGKQYEIKLSAKDAFGERNPSLMKTIPLKVFTEKNINPKPGMILNLDEMIAKIIAVSGARVITDFNNPLAGKDVEYKFKIVKKIDNENEKINAWFEMAFGFLPEYEIKDKVILKEIKKFEEWVNAVKDKFKALFGKELAFELKEEVKKNQVQDQKEKEEKEHEEIMEKAEKIKKEVEERTASARERREEDILPK